MVRPTRLRRPPNKFLGDEFVCAMESNKTDNKIGKRGVSGGNDKDTTREAENVAATNPQSSKGNLFDGEKPVVKRTARPKVLQDRTNLPGEHFKVDILVKKGADNKTATRSVKAARQTAKSAAREDDDDEAWDGVKNVGQTRAKQSATAKLTTESQSRDKENKENKETVPVVESTTKNAPKRQSGKAKNLKSTRAVDACDDSFVVESENATSDKKAKNGLTNEKAKKIKATKAKTVDARDDSLVIESENDTDSQNAASATSIERKTKKVRKSFASSKLSLSNRAKKIVETSGNKKSLRRSTKLTDKKENVPTTETTVEKKFFKGKVTGAKLGERRILLDKKTVTNRRRKINSGVKPKASTSFRMRQTTLGESFAKQATMRNTRPRATQKNNQNNSIKDDETSTNDQATKIKGPVYKIAKLLEKSDDNGGGSEVYEFNFNANDSCEKIPKKRKRKLVKGVGTKKTRAKVAKKTISKIKSKLVAASAKTSDKTEEARKELPVVANQAIDTKKVPTIVTSHNDSRPAQSTQSEHVDAQSPNVTPQRVPVEPSSPKPKILESVELTGPMRINLNSTPLMRKPAEENSRTLRLKNGTNARPSVPFRQMLGHALLNKSLSPITRALENFDPGSPWRPPPMANLQFSRVNNVVQSTPQVRKLSTISTKNNAASSNVNKPTDGNEKIIDTVETKAKPSAPKTFGSSKSPRKFGTEISNVNNSNSNLNTSNSNLNNSNSNPNTSTIIETNNKSEPNLQSPEKMENNPVTSRMETQSVTSFSEFVENPSNDITDKENSIPTIVSPKKSSKSPKKIVPRSLRIFGQSRNVVRENFNPQPGCSGLQKSNISKEWRTLRQSNLNNFLNLDEVPTSTTISSPHGIFTDVCSTPISGKFGKASSTESNVENAFGFDDDDETNENISPIKIPSFGNVGNEKNFNKIATKVDGNGGKVAPTRFSIGEIKKHLRPVNIKVNDKDDRAGKMKCKKMADRGVNTDDNMQVENLKKTDCDNFSDTFDLEVDANATKDKEPWKEVPLFADLEPVHFKQPPRHSYKRKRFAAFNFSDHEDDEDVEATNGHDNRATKKRKMSKLEKERQKKVEEWAKDLNNTFEEIDHFDLVVE